MFEWVTSGAFSLLAFIGMLSVLVVVHEMGHFFVAKRVGIRVEEFGLFFGKVLWSKQFGDTVYSLRMIPFGGFVKMTGQGDVGEAEESDASYSFANKPVWARAAVVVAGPLMNLVMAVAIFAVLNMTYGIVGRIGIMASAQLVAKSVEIGSLADEAGILEGGQIVGINDSAITTWMDVSAALDDDQEVRFSVKNPDGQFVYLSLERYAQVDSVGVAWSVPAIVGGVLPMKPAQRAGLMPGDRIESVDGVPIGDWDALRVEVGHRTGQSALVSVIRDGQSLTFSMTPAIDVAVRGEDGIRLNPFSAIWVGVKQTHNVMDEMVEFISRLIGRTMSTKHLAGPLGIAQMAGQAARRGIGVFLLLMAMLSTQLGILNMLPLAVLDGGHLLFFAFEALTGRRPSAKQQGVIQNVGAVMLLMLMAFVTVNDISRWLSN